jgi:two-component system capsular synthesis sensor histidine kinase RcsC
MLLSQSPTLLTEMRRYKRLVLFGGGALLTFMTVATFGLFAFSAFRTELALERESFVVEEWRLESELLRAESALRSLVYDAELRRRHLPRAKPDTAMLERFRANGNMLSLPGTGESVPLLYVGRGEAPPPAELARYFQVAAPLEDMPRARQAESSVGKYCYSAAEDFFVLSPMPFPGPEQIGRALQSRGRLLDALRTSGGKPLLEPLPPGQGYTSVWSRPVRWLAPHENPWTGQPSVRVAMHVVNRDRLGQSAGICVGELPLEAFMRPVAKEYYEGAFALVGESGSILAATSKHPLKAAVMERLRWAGALPPGDRSPAWGTYVFSEPVSGTGWRLIYVATWWDIFTYAWPHFRWATFMMLGTVIMLWTLLLLFTRRVFAPLVNRSRRVMEIERLNRTVIETAPIGLGVIPAQGGVPLLCSPTMNEAGQFLGGITSLTARLVEFHSRARTVDGRQGGVSGDLVIAAGADRYLSLAIHLVPTHYQDMDVLVVAFTDNSEQKRVEEALRAAKTAADDANRAKSSFLATISHEIRTPLHAILGNLELMERMEPAPRIQDRLQVTRSASMGLLNIVTDVLDFSKIEAGQMTVESVAFDLVALVGEVAQVFEPVAQAKGLRLDCVMGDGLAPCYIGDPTRIRQVASNLLSNAIKFTDHGEVLIEVYLQDEAAVDSQIVIGVSDTGIGLSPAQQSHLFEAFWQEDSMPMRHGGSGLGLALCQRFVHLMQGTIEVFSEAGRGSQFVVMLPLVPDACAGLRAGTALPAGQAGPAGGGRVLVVDDLEVNRALIRMQLETLGYQVELAASGEEALRLFAESRHDLVLMDLAMPGMDGHALTRCLRALPSQVPIVIVTAYAAVEVHRQCLAEGANRVLTKPVLLNELQQTLASLAVASVDVEAEGRAAAPAPLPPYVRDALVASARALFKTLHQAAVAGDRAALLRDLHALRGMFAMIQAKEVAGACAALELKARNDRHGDGRELSGRLREIEVMAWQALKKHPRPGRRGSKNP